MDKWGNFRKFLVWTNHLVDRFWVFGYLKIALILYFILYFYTQPACLLKVAIVLYIKIIAIFSCEILWKEQKNTGQARGRATTIAWNAWNWRQANGVETTLLFHFCQLFLLFVCTHSLLVKKEQAVWLVRVHNKCISEFIRKQNQHAWHAGYLAFCIHQSIFVSFETWEGNLGQGFNHYFYSFIHSFTYSTNIFIEHLLCAKPYAASGNWGVKPLCVCVCMHVL